MSKYKTWEVIKMLGEDPNLRFEKEDKKLNTKQVMGIDDMGYLYLKCEGCCDGIDGNIKPMEEWELVQKRASFIEAIKAYKEGKTIRCAFEGLYSIYEPETSIDHNPIIDNDGDAICVDAILNGKWYIEEEVI